MYSQHAQCEMSHPAQLTLQQHMYTRMRKHLIAQSLEQDIADTINQSEMATQTPHTLTLGGPDQSSGRNPATGDIDPNRLTSKRATMSTPSLSRFLSTNDKKINEQQCH